MDLLDFPVWWDEHAEAQINLQRKLLWTMAQHSVKPENVWNFDETAVGILRPGSSGWASKGLKKIAFIGKGDKRNWTAVVGTSMFGDKTLCQVIAGGSTHQCLAGSTAPAGSVLHDFSPSHWTTEDT